MELRRRGSGRMRSRAVQRVSSGLAELGVEVLVRK
jgi:hypothetical protein